MAFLTRMRSTQGASPPTDVVADLVDLHTRRPGITEQTLGVFTTSDGKTGYDLLADLVESSHQHVVELACGNGPLLALLVGKALTRITGLDACLPELDRARERIKDQRLVLLHETAQSLSVEDHSVDAVLSHHGFYLFDPIEPVISHLARVLKPGGLFAFMTAVPSSNTCKLYRELLTAFAQINRREVPLFKGWGDPRVWSLDSLNALLCVSPGGFSSPLKVEQFILHHTEAPGLLCDRLMRFFYSVELQSPEAQQELRTTWTAMLKANADRTGRVRFEFPATRISARRL